MRKVATSAFVIFLLIISLPSYSQSGKSRLTFSQEQANEELQKVLKDSSEVKWMVWWKSILIDSESAIQVAEPILFKLYGKERILSERPYKSYLIDHYWVLSGTVPEGHKGGCFLIVLDADNCRVVEVTHYE
jgi:hypothetical protein